MRAQGVDNFSFRDRSLSAGFAVRAIWWLALVALVIALFVGSVLSPRKISGTYFASTPTGAFLVVVAQTNGNQLTGRYEHVELEASGELEDTKRILSGAINKGTVVATLKPADFLSAILSETVTVSGTFDGRMLHLAGNGITLELLKGDEGSFQAQVKRLNERAGQTRAG